MANTFPSSLGIPASSSQTGTTAAIAAQLTPPTGRTAYLCGFVYQGSTATAAQNGLVTVTGTTPSGTLNFTYPTLASASTTPQPPPLVVSFNPPLMGSTTGSNGVVAVNGPALGTGATTCSVTAWGYYQ